MDIHKVARYQVGDRWPEEEKRILRMGIYEWLYYLREFDEWIVEQKNRNKKRR